MKIISLLILFCATAFGVDVSTTNVVPVVSINGNTFSNAVLVDLSPQSITIRHSRGFASFNFEMLQQADKEQFGLLPRTPGLEAELKTTNGMELLKAITPPPPVTNQVVETSFTNVIRVPPQLEFLTRYSVEDVKELLKNLPPAWLAALAVPVVFYGFICLCFHLICKKAGAPSALVWVPFVQFLPLLRAAKMSQWWFLLPLVPFALVAGLPFVPWHLVTPQIVGIWLCGFAACGLAMAVGQVIWCFKISSARGKSPLVGVCLLLPGLNIIGFLYLAFSK